MEKIKIRKWIAVTIVCFIAVSVQVISLSTKKIIEDDEGVSIITAACNQDNYEYGKPAEKWSGVSEWKKFWEPDRKFCFRTIGNGLAHQDIHPPLYFWLLHIWLLIFKTTLWTGASLNLIFFVGIFLLIYKVSLHVLNSFNLAIASAFVWGISPSVLEFMKEARQYALLALITIAFLAIILQLVNTNKKINFLSFLNISILSFLGIGTHYYFTLMIGGASIIVLVHFWRKFKFVIYYGLSVLGGIVFFLLIHPSFLLSFQRQQEQAKDFSFDAISERVYFSAQTFYSFYFQGNIGKIAFSLCGLFILIGIVAYFRNSKIKLHIKNTLTNTHKNILFLFVFLSLMVIGLYLSFISPRHAMIAKYLSMVHIYIVLSTFIMIAMFKNKTQLFLTLGLVAWQLFMGIWFIQREVKRFENIDKLAINNLQQVKEAIIDIDERTVLPSVLWYFSENSKVYVSKQDKLLVNSDNWKNALSGEIVYISDYRFNNSIEMRDKIISEIIDRGYSIKDSGIFIFNSVSRIYRFEPD